ncbi:DUF2938 family protein [Aeromicrobium phragmitis]|uniref:DUF2938 family protein n=1 Tax=Aeromicrobium phragmitis TaxID=2478914 RepID=A0A3L8PKR0_9ACTN|nr:DUF2938 family protein [Aeromicrobium phragmitis]RLV55178.1 DUF2938 family protein [Aeromicrobium phragmitis]
MNRWNCAATAVAIGCGATAIMDLAGEVIRHTSGGKPLDHALVRRRIGHFTNGTFTYETTGQSEPVQGAKALGWAAHYASGTTFAGRLLLNSPDWRVKPTLAPALETGALTRGAPWFLMQRAFGLGAASSKTPDPTTARWRSLRAHSFYGSGMYVVGVSVAKLRGQAGRDDRGLVKR